MRADRLLSFAALRLAAGLGVLAPGAAAQVVIDLATEDEIAVVHGERRDDRAGLFAKARDLSGDGIADLILGHGTRARGGLDVLFGPFAEAEVIDLDAVDADVTVLGTGGIFAKGPGQSFAVGDVNGDGTLDLALGDIGAPSADPFAFSGVVQVFFGPFPEGTVLDPFPGSSHPADLVVLDGASTVSRLGTSLSIEDVTGDGVADLVMGAPRVFSSESSVEILIGPVGAGVRDLSATPADARVVGESGADELGLEIAIGDVSGDGLPDLAIHDDEPAGPMGDREGAGGVHVVFGPFAAGSTRMLATDPADVIVHGAEPEDRLAFIQLVDANADGSPDLVVSAFAADGPGNARPGAGEVHVAFGPLASGTVLDLLTTAADLTIHAEAGASLRAVSPIVEPGPAGRTGLLLFTAGTDGPAGARENAGSARMLFAPAAGVIDLASATPDAVVHGAEPGGRLGRGVFTVVVGDLTADGVPDVALPAPGGDGPEGSRENAGEVRVLPGASLGLESPVTCDAGDDVLAGCNEVALSGTVDAPSGAPLPTEWTSSCAGTSFLPSAGELDATAVFPSSCDLTCTLTLTVGGDLCSDELVVEIDDDVPPALSPPDDLTVECPAPSSGPGSEAGWLSRLGAEDDCSTATPMSAEVVRTPGCGATFSVTHELWAVDECGNESERVRRTYEVVDTTPPEVMPPDDLIVECPAPESGPLSEVAWRSRVRATDACGAVEAFSELVETLPGCGATFTNVVEFWAVDECGNESERLRRRYEVVDTTPPDFTAPEPLFDVSLWPPDHGHRIFATGDLASATDACGEVAVVVSGCSSSQPEEVHAGHGPDGGQGDGRTFEDCAWSIDGSQVAARAERLGACGGDSARTYTVELTATDECGNAAIATGRLLVAHDRAVSSRVPRGRRLAPRDPLPFAAVHETEYGEGCGP